MKEHLNAILNSYSEIFFLRGALIGVVMLLVTLVNPNVSAAGIIAVVSAYLFARLIRMDREFLKSGFYTYNPLLVGLSIGYLFRVTPLTIFLIVAAGILTFVFTNMLFSIFSYYLRLPVLSLPFVVISSIAYLASSQYSNLFVNSLYPKFTTSLELYLPAWISGLLKALGAILFVPDVTAGLIFLAIIFFSSRILFLLVILGYYSGTLLTAAMLGSFRQAFLDLNHLNFILIAIAIGGIFLIPSPRAYLMATIAVITSTLVVGSMEVFWSSFGIPAFMLPFNLVSLAFIYVLGLINFPLVSRFIKETPEESLDYYISTTNRFKGTERTLALPFSGKWRVWQGFNGKWTHQGSWRYAYDFVIADESGSTYQNDGSKPEDYHAFRKPVLSPVRGRVTLVINDLPDNPISRVDKTNNWGNAVIIHDPRGFYAELSHFAQNSIKVKEGDWVERGAILGLCGNSGYSPQPHIHLQAQLTEELGAHTALFSFVNYLVGGQYFSNDVPAENKTLEPLHPDKSMDIKTSFILDQEYCYEVLKSGQKIDELNLTVRMALDGSFYFDSGRGKLYFGKHEGTFYFYSVEGNDPFLNCLFIALPRLPLAQREQLQWEDYVPVGAVASGFKKGLTLFLSSFYHGLNKINVKCEYQGRNIIKGAAASKFLNFRGETEVELHDYGGFRRVRLNDIEIRRISDEESDG